MSFSISASDPDIPLQRLRFSLDPPTPPGAAINSTNGLFTWMPVQAQALNSYALTVRVTDSGSPNRSSTQSFTVTVLQHPFAPVIEAVAADGDGAAISWKALAGKRYRVQYKNNLNDPDWTDLSGDVVATGATAAKVDLSIGASTERYYRVLSVE